MTFDESTVNRRSDGRFGNRSGQKPEVSLAPKRAKASTVPGTPQTSLRSILDVTGAFGHSRAMSTPSGAKRP